MVDFHIENLVYDFKPRAGFSFENPPAIEHTTEDFRMRLSHSVLWVEMIRHFEKEKDARKYVDEYLETWQQSALLEYGAVPMDFEFKTSKLVDRNATNEGNLHGVVRIQLGAVTCSATGIAMHPPLSQYPAPPTIRDHLTRTLLKCLWSASADPANELVHLYEIRDALKTHFDDENNARKILGISSSKWERLRRLCNGPLKQGRHRGLHFETLRDATHDELAKARKIAMEMIEAYLNH